MRMLKRLTPLLVALGVLLVFFRILVPTFLQFDNLLDLAQQVSINAILAFGMTLVILSGGIDLSVGALLALVGTTTVYFLTAGSTGLGLWLAIPAGLGVAVLFGVGNGLCASRTRMPPFIVTLATMLIARGAALRFNQGRPMHIPEAEGVFLALGNGRWFGFIPVPVVVMLLLFAATAVLLHRSRFGQHLYALGGNREAARFTGIPVARVEIIAYVLCSLLAGCAGMIHASQLYSAEPSSGVMFELHAIAAAVVGGTSFTGGRGTLYGTLLGACIIGTLDKGLNQAGVHFSLQYIIKGMVILAAVYIDVRRTQRTGRPSARSALLFCLVLPLCFAPPLYAQGTRYPDYTGAISHTATPFKEGDRIAFIGDSITHGGLYFQYASAYYVTRFPDARVTWFNNGLNGDTAKGAIKRFGCDIMLTKPNRAIIMLGMNDIRRSEYKSANPDDATRNRLRTILDTYQQDMATLVDRLVAHGVEVIVLGPSLYDNTVDSPAGNAFGANDALSQCSEFLKAMAAKKGLGYVDFNAPMRIANGFLQEGNPHASIISVHDRVHPGPVGTLMMAYLLLKGQGVPAEVATVEVDVADPSRTRGANCTVSNMEMTVDGVSYLYLPVALPFPVVAGYLETDRLVPFTDELNREMITVHGLKDGIYRLEMDGVEVGRYTAHELKLGINIAILPANPGQVQSQRIMKSFMARMPIEQNLRIIQEALRSLPDDVDVNDVPAVKAYMEAYIEEHRSDDYPVKRFKLYLEVHKPKEAEYIRQIEEWHTGVYSESQPQARKVSIRHVAGRENVPGKDRK